MMVRRSCCSIDGVARMERSRQDMRSLGASSLFRFDGELVIAVSVCRVDGLLADSETND